MIRAVKRVWRSFRTGLAFLYFWVGGTIIGWVLLPILAFRMRRLTPGERLLRCQEFVGRGFMVFHDYMRNRNLVMFDPREVEAKLPDHPCVLIANHPTLVDVTAVLSVYHRVVCVAGGYYFKLPLVRPLLRSCGHIDGGDGSSMAGAAVMQAALEHLAAGRSVLIFPEGTRSPPGGLREFRRGAFEIACRARVPILPVFITCDPPALMKGVPWYKFPMPRVEFRVNELAPVSVEAFNSDARALRDHFQEMYVEHLAAFHAAAAERARPQAAQDGALTLSSETSP